MKQSLMYIPMTKENPNSAVCASHILGLKAGLMHQTAAGIYTYLPLATKMLNNIETIIREELEKIGANELILPLLEPAELWEKTGRWQGYGSELFRVVDRKNTAFALCPTHEEVITDLVKNYLVTYKKYPVNLFQIATKMRDEARPRFGLLRGREFVMMDGYSFHTNLEDLDKTYNDYYQAYCNIFERLGLEFRVVQADNGKIGGSSSHEFMALAPIGEDTIAYVENTKSAYNVEIAPVYYEEQAPNEADFLAVKKVTTPGCKKCEEVAEFLGNDLTKHVKAVAIKGNKEGSVVLFMLRSDRTLNEVKATKLAAVDDFILADEADLQANGLVEGFMGPIGCSDKVKVFVDQEVKDLVNVVIGANEENAHLINVNFRRDVNNATYCDLREVEEGDYLDKDLGPVKFARGIEIGHIFALGDKYTKDLEVKFLNENQQQETPVMGCYGIGVSRLISAIIEQNNDENGIVMPKSVTPFDLHLLVLDYNKNEEQRQYANKLAKDLEDNGFKVLIDDREVNPGVKFSEADLLGLPYRITIGKKLVDNEVEIKERSSGEVSVVNTNDVIDFIKKNY